MKSASSGKLRADWGTFDLSFSPSRERTTAMGHGLRRFGLSARGLTERPRSRNLTAARLIGK